MMTRDIDHLDLPATPSNEISIKLGITGQSRRTNRQALTRRAERSQAERPVLNFEIRLMARVSLNGEPSARDVVVSRTATSSETLAKPAASSPWAQLGARKEWPSQRRHRHGHNLVLEKNGQAIDVFVG
jgi:hypothetical protein